MPVSSYRVLLCTNPCFRYIHDVSVTLKSAYDMPWRGPLRFWHQIVIKLITAWNCYHVAVDWPFGKMSHELQETFLKQLQER